jgi:bifunctional oligoribonuclease and PAP phosphatase NrnA
MTQTQKEPPTLTTDFDAVVDALAGHDRFLVVTHENPDGDALGSMLGATLGLRSLGKDVVMHLSGSAPLPAEYGFMALEEVRREPPADAGERVLLALDCANERRLGPDAALLGLVPLVVDVDHHHDNTRFGSVNLVVADASSTAEIVRDLLRALGVELTPDMAEALYIGLVTDTGRFQYSNTTPKALRLAADLVEAGADVHGVFKHVYETVQFAKLKLLARALEHARVFEGGRLVISHLQRSDFVDAGAEEPYSEGIIDFLRQSEGSQLVALIREPSPNPGAPKHRISLRSSTDEIDVSAIARKSDGGGHVQAAGFSSDLDLEEIVEFIRREFLAVAGETA